MDNTLSAFFREAQDITLSSDDKASVRSIISGALRLISPAPAPAYAPVRVVSACAR